MLGVLGWGALADRRGERLVVLLGLLGGAALLTAAAFSTGPSTALLLVASGAAGSALYASSGRIVVGWFPPRQRGLAMGIRQTSQPLGVALAAALLLTDAPATTAKSSGAGPSPYRGPILWGLHGASALMVIAQLATAAFALDYLVTEHRLAAVTAGHLLAVIQLAGAVGRIAMGRWSDQAGSRLRPLQATGLACAVLLVGLATASAAGSASAVLLLMLALVVTVSWHGVGYAAVAEAAPQSWSGRAVSAHTLAQNLAAVLAPPAAGLVFGTAGFAGGYAALALPPLAAAALLNVLSRTAPPAAAEAA
ncbi:MFS transporter [Micromonospora sp. NPDC005171]|uniref:MFS transporter n=1 Tax=Micromonospora sp. NPDC005171 TaxID=3156866 RepID=UPI0033B9D8AA